MYQQQLFHLLNPAGGSLGDAAVADPGDSHSMNAVSQLDSETGQSLGSCSTTS
jgi:hypothetical protein